MKNPMQDLDYHIFYEMKGSFRSKIKNSISEMLILLQITKRINDRIHDTFSYVCFNANRILWCLDFEAPFFRGDYLNELDRVKQAIPGATYDPYQLFNTIHSNRYLAKRLVQHLYTWNPKSYKLFCTFIKEQDSKSMEEFFDIYKDFIHESKSNFAECGACDECVEFIKLPKVQRHKKNLKKINNDIKKTFDSIKPI